MIIITSYILINSDSTLMVPVSANYQLLSINTHCLKSVHTRSLSGPYFHALGLNKDRYGVSPCIQSKYGKIRTRKTPNMDTFNAVTTVSLSKRTIVLQKIKEKVKVR